MAVLWSRHHTYPRCRQCECGCVFTFTADQVRADGSTPCQECNAPCDVTDQPRPGSSDDTGTAAPRPG